MTTAVDAKATREFIVLNIICGHTGKLLTADLVDRIVKEICKEMQSGATAWAFTGHFEE